MQTFWMLFFCSGVNSGDVSSVLYCIFVPYYGGAYFLGP